MQHPFSVPRHLCRLALVAACVCLIGGCGKGEPDAPDSAPAENSAAGATGESGAPDSPAAPGPADDSTTPEDRSAPAAGNTPASAKPTTPEEEVYAALDDARSRLKSGDIRGFFENYMPPDELEKLQANEAQFNSLIDQLKEMPERVNQLLQTIDYARQGKLEFEEDGTVAVLREDDGLNGTADSAAAIAYEAEFPRPPLGSSGTDLPSTIKAGLAALEAGSLQSFVNDLFPEGALAHPDSERQVALAIARMKENPAAVQRMIADFKALTELTPQMEEADTMAVYKLPGEKIGEGVDALTTPERTIRFQQVEGTWRLYDNSRLAHQELVRQSKLAPPKFQGRMLAKLIKVNGSWRIEDFGRAR